MRYRIKYSKNGVVVHTTTLRWHSWDQARYFLEYIMRWRFNPITHFWEKENRDEQAEIVCQNGIPF